VGQNVGLGTIAQLYGVIHQMNGDIETAIECHTEALDLHTETGYDWGQAAAHLFIGGLQLHSAAPDPAKFAPSLRHLRAAYTGFQTMGDYWGMGAATGVVGAVALQNSQVEIGGKLLGSAQESIRLGHSFLPPYIEGIVAEAVTALQSAIGPGMTELLLIQGRTMTDDERDAFVLAVLEGMIAAASKPIGVRPPTRLQMPLVRLLEEGLDPRQAAKRLHRDQSSVYEMLDRIQERLGIERWQDIVPTARTHGHLPPQ
ncbi:MAG TPA: hypothetical protein PK691_12460, partial [Thermomicrobiales bacterium]|nr:hypothetical protein [Thermomicrobiales bacterium]